MSSGPKRIEDKVNSMAIVMIGICGAVLVYVSIAALQAFYSNDVADVQTMADYGGQDQGAKDLRAKQMGNISTVGATGKTDKGPTYQIKIDDAMKKTLEQFKVDPADLVPMVAPQKTPTILPVFGRPKLITATAGSGSGSAAPAADGAGSASGSGVTAGSGAPAAPPTAGSGAH